jgi:hypothetical protein
MDENMEILFSNIQIKERETFLDYIFGGCKITVGFAVCFSSENEHRDHH